MGGRSHCVSPKVASTWWIIATDGFGEHRIHDVNGVDVLRHPVPIERLRNRYLAAAAPMLRYALSEAVRELERRSAGTQTREGLLVAWLWDVLHSAKPLYVEELRLEGNSNQLGLYLEATDAQGVTKAA